MENHAKKILIFIRWNIFYFKRIISFKIRINCIYVYFVLVRIDSFKIQNYFL